MKCHVDMHILEPRPMWVDQCRFYGYQRDPITLSPVTGPAGSRCVPVYGMCQSASGMPFRTVSTSGFLYYHPKSQSCDGNTNTVVINAETIPSIGLHNTLEYRNPVNLNEQVFIKNGIIHRPTLHFDFRATSQNFLFMIRGTDGSWSNSSSKYPRRKAMTLYDLIYQPRCPDLSPSPNHVYTYILSTLDLCPS